MIHYQLQCADGHEFEGWFRDSSAFDDQSKRKLLTCPACASSEVQRGLMAPSVRGSRKVRPARDVAAGDESAADPRPIPLDQHEAAGMVALPDQMRSVLQKLRAEVERRCDDVGDRFAEAARVLHREAERRGPAAVLPPSEATRGIYGTMSEADREALSDEGIETTRIPWLPRADG